MSWTSDLKMFCFIPLERSAGDAANVFLRLMSNNTDPLLSDGSAECSVGGVWGGGGGGGGDPARSFSSHIRDLTSIMVKKRQAFEKFQVCAPAKCHRASFFC